MRARTQKKKQTHLHSTALRFDPNVNLYYSLTGETSGQRRSAHRVVRTFQRLQTRYYSYGILRRAHNHIPVVERSVPDSSFQKTRSERVNMPHLFIHDERYVR